MMPFRNLEANHHLNIRPASCIRGVCVCVLIFYSVILLLGRSVFSSAFTCLIWHRWSACSKFGKANWCLNCVLSVMTSIHPSTTSPQPSHPQVEPSVCVSLGGSVCIFFSISRLLLRLRLIILHEYILCHRDHKYTSLWFLIISEETLSFIFFHNPTRCNNILVPALCKVSRNSLFPISMRWVTSVVQSRVRLQPV